MLARVIAVTFCVTLAAALAARLGPIPMAAFQTCLQVWMTSSLLSDGLAVAGQVVKQKLNSLNSKTSFLSDNLYMFGRGAGSLLVISFMVYDSFSCSFRQF